MSNRQHHIVSEGIHFITEMKLHLPQAANIFPHTWENEALLRRPNISLSGEFQEPRNCDNMGSGGGRKPLFKM